MQNVNLMPPGYAENERAKRRLMICGAVMVAVVLAMFGLSKRLDRSTGNKERTKVILERGVTELRSARSELATCNSRLQVLSDRLSVVHTLDHNRRWASYLAQIAQAASDQIVLSRAKICAVRRKTDDSGRPAPGTALPAPVPPAGAAAATQTKPGEDLSKPEKLLLLLEGYALSNTDVTRFISALTATGIFERVTFKGSQVAMINTRQLSRFELECPIRYEHRKRPTEEAGPKQADEPAAPRAAAALSGAHEPGTGDHR